MITSNSHFGIDGLRKQVNLKLSHHEINKLTVENVHLRVNSFRI